MSITTRPKHPIMDLLEAKLPAMKEVATKYVTPERQIRLLGMMLTKDQELAKCHPITVLGCVVTSVQLGLELGGPLGMCYIIPRKGVATLQVGYRGYIDILTRGGAVRSIEAHAVYAGDDFVVTRGTTPHIHHEVAWDGDRTDEKAVAFYTVANVASGERLFEVMSRKQVEHIRDKYGHKNGKAWADSFAQMGRKTVLHRHQKYLPISYEAREPLAIAESLESNGGVIEIGGDLPAITTSKIDELPDIPELPAPDNNKPAFDVDELAAQMGDHK